MRTLLILAVIAAGLISQVFSNPYQACTPLFVEDVRIAGENPDVALVELPGTMCICKAKKELGEIHLPSGSELIGSDPLQPQRQYKRKLAGYLGSEGALILILNKGLVSTLGDIDAVCQGSE